MAIEPELVAEGLKLYFITNDIAFLQVIEEACPSSYEISSVAIDQLLGGETDELLRKAYSCDVVLWLWDLELAHAFSKISNALRRRGVPLIAICEEESDIVPALLTGADEAMTLPIETDLLEARVAVYHRWIERHTAEINLASDIEAAKKKKIVYGPITLDLKARMLFILDKPVELTFKEFELLGYLMKHPGACCTRDEILDKVWGLDFDTGTNMVEVYMFYLRRKLKKYNLGRSIQTVRGAGYRFNPPKEEKNNEEKG